MAGEIKKFYEFGEFRFDAQKLRLEYSGETVCLPPKSLETLKVLLEHRGETVSRESLLEELWTESFVEEANLTVTVSRLRKALSARSQDETFIQTVPRRGYRFVADAEEKIELAGQPIIVEKRSLESLMIEETSDAPNLATLMLAPKKRSLVTVFVVLLAVVGIAAAFVVWDRSGKNNSQIQKMQQAREAFLKGDLALKKRQPCESIPYLQEAVTHDPGFALAFANLAAAQAMCGVREGAEENVARALALNPNLAEAHAADGFIRMFRQWDWDAAEEALRRAVALDPDSATAHHWLGVCFSIRGRLAEARGEMRRAIDLDPTLALYYADLGQIYYFLRNSDFAADYCRQALALDPNFYFANLYLRDIYLMLGNEKEAAVYEIKSAITYGKPLDSVSGAREILERDGFKSYWQYRLDLKLDEWNGNKVSPDRRSGYQYDIARLYTALGDKENALRWLDEAVSESAGVRPFRMAYIGVDPFYDRLRDDPRFAEILRKMNLRK